MAFDLEEQEKIDQLKAWWQRYGAWVNAVLMAALLAMVAYYGWQWYQQYQHQNALKQYDALQTLLRQSPLPTQALVETANGLQRDYGSTPHAVRASFAAADALWQAGDKAAAAKLWQWIAKDSADVASAPVATLLLANAWIDEARFDDVHSLLATPPAAFEALYFDRLGDAFLAKGDVAQALQWWEKASAVANDLLRNTIDTKRHLYGE